MKFLDLFRRQATPFTAKRAPLVAALEPRMMFDGAVAATAVDAASSADHQSTDASQTQTADDSALQSRDAATPLAATGDQRQEIVFVDGKLQDAQQLIAGLPSGAEVVVLDSNKDGLQQIADYLKDRSDVDAIHLLSHGAEGTVELGNTWLNAQNIGQHSQALNAIGAALAADGDILIYGCDTGEGTQGATLLSELARLTQADVAASDDATGAASKGGDWQLEHQVGQIESASLNLEGYQSLLVAPADQDFDNHPNVPYAFTGPQTIDGITYNLVSPAGGKTTITAKDGIFSITPEDLTKPYGFDLALVFNMDQSTSVQAGPLDARISSADGSEFSMVSMEIDTGAFTPDPQDPYATNPNLTITGYLNGVAVASDTVNTGVSDASGSITYTKNAIAAGFGGTLTFSSAWQYVDEIRITGTDTVVAIDDLNFEAAVNPNVTPVISNLNGDSVAWAGVGNTVTLDTGGNASLTDAEFGALNSSNGNWNGASLTVQRPGTAVPADIFGFNTFGASFTVSDNNLQSGGQTFATFVNTGGVLTITYTSSGTAATTVLVNDVARHITYRNDTPAGDANIRFTLSDGSSSTTADVTVTSDSIYVTNASDTAAIDVSNGVSFSEAVAIAAADTTGNQTIVIASSLAGETVSTLAASALSENLTLNLDSASGVTLSGGSLAIAPSVALTVTNGETDTATFTTALTGSGSFTKLGTGTLVLDGTSTTYTGSVVVGQGVLTVAHNNALGTTASGVTVSSGASLRIADGITIADALNLSGAGNNASGALQLAAGSATVSGNINLSTTVVSINSAGALSLSGVIGGTNLASTGTGSLILSGTNSYGNTTVSAGTLSVASDNHLGFNPITLASGTTLAVTGATTIDNGITLTGAATISNTANVTIDGVISGGHNLTKAGSGVLTLARDNTYAATNVDAGTLSVSSDSNLGSGTVTLAAGTTLAINGATTIDNTIALTGAATISNTANATIDGVISGAHNLTKAGSATLTLAANNTYSGNTIVSAGGLTLTGGSSIGDGSAVSVASGATLTLGGGSETIGSLLGDGNIVLGYNLTTGGNNASTTFSGVISGTGNGITKTGSGTFTLSGSNTYTGSTTVSAGTLALSGGAAMSDASAVTVSSGATLSLIASETLGSLAGAGNVSLNGFTLSSGGNNTSTTFSGGLIGSGGFAKTGSGTLTLSGSNSGTFTGDTAISGGGTLSVASDDNLGSGLLSINNSTLSITGATTIDNSIALTNSATISNTSAVTLSGAISDSGNLSKAGSGVLSLSGTSNYGGSTTVLAGTLSVTGALTGTSAVSVSSGATLTGSGSVTNLVVSSGGTLAPGNGGAGIFTVNGNLQMNSGSTLAMEINGTTAGTGYDQVMVSGTVSIAGTLALTHGYVPGQGDSYTLIDNDTADFVTGTFSGLAEGGTVTAGGNSTVLTASYIGGSGNDFTLTAPINAAPVIGNLNGDSVTFIEDGAPILLDAGNDATVTDSDSVDFDGGTLTVTIVANRVNAEDVLSIRHQGTAGGEIGTSGLNITYGGTIIGTRTANGGTDSHDLVITLNSSATPAIVQALMRNLTYINTNTTTPDTAARTVRIMVNDGDGGISSHAEVSVAVTAVSDAPSTPDLAAGSDSGSSNSDNLTHDTTPIFTGTAEVGSTVTLYAGNTALGTGVATGGVWSITSSTLGAGTHHITAKATDAAGNVSDLSTSLAVTVDTSAPTLAISSNVAQLKAGDTATITFTFSEDPGTSFTSSDIVVSGGTLGAISGSGLTRTATFTPTSGVNGGTASITVAGGSYVDAAGNNGGAGTMPSLSFDTSAPNITGIVLIASPSSASSIIYTVTFDENVNGLDTRDFTLIPTGTASGTISSINTSDGRTYQVLVNGLAGVGSLGLNLNNSGTGITDIAGNWVAGGMIGDVHHLDLEGPSVTGVNVPANGSYKAGDLLSFTLNTSENLIINLQGGTPRLVLDIGGSRVFADFLSSTGSALTFQYSVQSGLVDADGISVSGLESNGATLRDAAGNDLNLQLNSVGATNGVLVDALAPQVASVTVPASGHYAAGSVLTFTVQTSEAITLDSSNGSPRLVLDIGGSRVYADLVSSSGSALTFQYSVQSGQVDADGISVSSLESNGATLRDAAGNDLNLTLNSVGAINGVLVDTLAPQVASVTVPASGHYGAGSVLTFTVQTSEAITLDSSNGSPRLVLDIGGSRVYADLVSSSGSALTFQYSVQSGQVDADGISVSSLESNGATLRDAAGNDLNLQLNSVGATNGVLVDALAPQVASVTVPASGHYGAGSVLTFTVQTSEAITLDSSNGSPRLVLDIGGSRVFADFVSRSGNALTFQYTVQSGQVDADGISITGLQANGATLRDVGGNDLNLTLNNVAATDGVRVDTLPPQATDFTLIAEGASAGSQSYLLAFNGAVTGVDVADFSLVLGGTAKAVLKSVIQISPAQYQVTLGSLSGTGTVAVTLNPTDSQISNSYGTLLQTAITSQVLRVTQTASADVAYIPPEKSSTGPAYSDLQKLYIAYFNRPADSAGLSFWASAVGGSASISSLAAAFSSSAEYKDHYASHMAADLTSIYQNIFNRAPDAAGMAFFTDALQKGMTLEALIAAATGTGPAGDAISGDKAKSTDFFRDSLGSGNSGGDSSSIGAPADSPAAPAPAPAAAPSPDPLGFGPSYDVAPYMALTGAPDLNQQLKAMQDDEQRDVLLLSQALSTFTAAQPQG